MLSHAALTKRNIDDINQRHLLFWSVSSSLQSGVPVAQIEVRKNSPQVCRNIREAF